ncbi:MAG TPA: serine/threonine-protein kinase [Gemmatimonadaceae bacterium]|nr:serine/threonine-protein kinase [Gemmatimonadaceae bacterium]
MTDPLRDRVVAAVGEMFDIQEELGRGGMSVVYRALDLRLHRHVAIKVLPPEFAFRPEVRSRFLREAETAAQLTHPNIVPIYAVDERAGIVHIVMACVDGETLGARLARSGRLSVADAVRMLREVADALAYAHAHGVVHRDIKPENILLDRESGRALVTDFGIARAAEADARLTVTGVAIGTPAYMSPEQALGDRDLDGRSDLYSLGVVAYHALAGVLPFEASNTPAMMMKHVTEAVPALRARRPEVPAPVEHAIMRALAKRRDDRWPDARAFRDALDARAPAAPSHPRAQAPWEHPRVERQRPARAPAPRADPAAPRTVAPRTVAPAPAADAPSIEQRAREFRAECASSGVVVLGLALVNFVTTPFVPWFVVPAVGIGVRLSRKWSALLAAGGGWRHGAAIAPVHAPALPASAPPEKSAERGAASRRGARGGRDARRKRTAPEETTDAALRALVPSAVQRGPYGSAVRRAAADRRAIAAIVQGLAEADRALIPDVVPTANALTQRVAALAQILHQLDADVSPEAAARVDEHIARVQAEPEGAADRERRLTLLERQRATILDLRERRVRVSAQLESAGLALQTLRLDLLKLRSAGVQAALDGVTSATMQARALSRDIGYVLDAAAEIRDL